MGVSIPRVGYRYISVYFSPSFHPFLQLSTTESFPDRFTQIHQHLTYTALFAMHFRLLFVHYLHANTHVCHRRKICPSYHHILPLSHPSPVPKQFFIHHVHQ